MLTRHSAARIAVASAFTLGVATGIASPASAGEDSVSRACLGMGGIAYGFINAQSAQTHTDGGCGTIGVRVRYHNIGGWHVTAWKTCTCQNVMRSVKPNNAYRGYHYGHNTGTFVTQQVP